MVTAPVRSIASCCAGIRARILLSLLLVAFLCMPTASQIVRGSDDDAIDRPISGVRIVGVERVDEQLVRNNIRVAVGDPYDPSTVRADLRRLEQLGQFRRLDAYIEIQADGSVHVIYLLEEQPVIAEIQVVGNTLLSDRELRNVMRVARGGPVDEFLIESSIQEIQQLYRERGHYLVSVNIDRQELEASGILIFRVIEGPRIRIRAVEFEGNEAFEDRQLHAQVSTRTAILILRRGELDEDRLIEDVAALDAFYKDRGYLDVRVDRVIELSPDNREAKVTFVIDEGQPYVLRSVVVESRRTGEPLEVFSREQIMQLLEIRPGDVYSQDLLRKSIRAITDAYGRLGYVGTRVFDRPSRSEERGQVDLVLEVHEGTRATVGMVNIQGNFLTKDKVIRREVRLRPGRPLDETEVERSTRRLRNTRLYNDVRITILDPEPDDPLTRDVLVEVRERNTGAINFGLAAGSDTGLFGELSLTQDNFDIADWPDSWGELFRGRAFRGAGQRFSMTFRPGNEIFEYSTSLTEPNFLDTNYSVRVSGSYLQREFRRHDETRSTGFLQVGRRLGDFWTVGARTRVERVKLTNIQPSAPTAFFDDAGPDAVTALGMTLTRSTFATVTRPGRGSRFEVGYDRIGALGGDFDFNRLTADYTTFITLDEDFIGRLTTLRLNTEIGYIFGGHAPPYERFYRGGRTFRGFRFREISPKGIAADTGEISRDPVGGRWMFFAGAQYEFPIFGEAITGVFFLDSGTVTDNVGFDDYRVSIGTGLRLYIPQFGPVPIAFDFGFPIKKKDTDERQVISFSADLPF